MKEDESADCAEMRRGRLVTGLCFFFFWGLENLKFILKTRISARFRFTVTTRFRFSLLRAQKEGLS